MLIIRALKIKLSTVLVYSVFQQQAQIISNGELKITQGFQQDLLPSSAFYVTGLDFMAQHINKPACDKTVEQKVILQ